MLVCHELPLPRESLERLAFQNLAIVATQVVENLPIQDEKAGTHPTLNLGLLREAGHLRPLVNHRDTETRHGLYCRDGGEPSMGGMKREKFRNVDVREPISVGDDKRIALDVRRNPFHATSCHRV